MANCIVAQSGGPTSVINATVAGIVKGNQMHPIYDHVYGGLNGIEGILAERFVDLTHLSETENRVLQQTPSSALGSCRYKLSRDNKDDYRKLINIMEKHDIDTMFYIGGNDSMDTVAALSEFVKEEGIEGRRFIGCPKTIDNDLIIIDHCPGFASAAKFIAMTALQTWLDVTVYPSSRKEVFILETMGRDAGWLASSACLSGKIDLLILPEDVFDREVFCRRVRECIEKNSKCYIVVSEGARYADGTYISSSESKNDLFGHAVLGGAGDALAAIIKEEDIAPRVKVQDLALIQRSHSTEQSLIDRTEAYRLGLSAHMYANDKDFNGKMVGIKRIDGEEYDVEYFAIDASKVANQVKQFPKEWILPEYKGIAPEAYDYLKPLITGTPYITYKDGLPAYIEPFYINN